MMEFLPVLHRTIRSIDAIEWDSLAGDSAFATWGWLLTVETCWRAKAEPLYFTLRQNGVLIAASVCYAIDRSDEVETLDDMVFGRVKSAAHALRLSFLPAFVCGPALGYGWHIGVNPGLTADARDRARRLVLDAMETEAQARGLHLSFVHVLDDERELRTLLEERGYLRSENVPVAVLDLGFESFDDYLATLPSKKRITFRRQMSRNRDAGTVVELARGAAGYDDERLLSLLDANAQKHGGIQFACGPKFFAALDEYLGSRARIFTARKSGIVTAVVVMLIQNRTAFPIAVGVDPDSADDYTYFQVSYNSPIAHAIESGISRMYYGRGMYDLKVRRGCWLARTWIYSRQSSLRGLVIAGWFALASAWNRRQLSSDALRALKA